MLATNYLAHVVRAIVDILGAIFPRKSWQTVTSVMGEMVDTFTPIFTRRKLIGAEWDLDLKHFKSNFYICNIVLLYFGLSPLMK